MAGQITEQLAALEPKRAVVRYVDRMRVVVALAVAFADRALE